ncbi:MAG TPA: hypothetical protein VN931_03045 [Fibrobacteria bacterium]|nr:hypothetical protein [Fibrobacteria bacterium]
MNGSKITIALALAAMAGAYADVPDSLVVKVDSLNSGLLRTEKTVGMLSHFKVGGLVQFQYMYFTDTGEAGGNAAKQGAWAIKRGRIKTTYDAGNGVSAVWQPNFDETGAVTSKDAFLQFEEPWLKSFGIRGGLQDIPFGFEIPYSSAAIETQERSRFENNGPFNGEKDVGLVLFVHPAQIPFLNAKIGWTNGQGINASYQDPKDIVGRLGFNTSAQDLGLGVSGGVSFYNNMFLSATDTIREVVSSAMTKEGGRMRDDLDAHVVGADLQAMYKFPFGGSAKVMAEYYGGKVVGATNSLKPYLGVGNADIRNAMGYYVTGVLNPLAMLPQLQLVYRFDYYDPNTDVSGNSVDAKTGFSSADLAYVTNKIGVNVYLNANLMLSLDYDFIANETTNAPSMDGWSSDVGRTVAQGALKTGTYKELTDFSKNVDDDQLNFRIQVMY